MTQARIEQAMGEQTKQTALQEMERQSEVIFPAWEAFSRGKGELWEAITAGCSDSRKSDLLPVFDMACRWALSGLADGTVDPEWLHAAYSSNAQDSRLRNPINFLVHQVMSGNVDTIVTRALSVAWANRQLPLPEDSVVPWAISVRLPLFTHVNVMRMQPSLQLVVANSEPAMHYFQSVAASFRFANPYLPGGPIVHAIGTSEYQNELAPVLDPHDNPEPNGPIDTSRPGILFIQDMSDCSLILNVVDLMHRSKHPLAVIGAIRPDLYARAIHEPGNILLQLAGDRGVHTLVGACLPDTLAKILDISQREARELTKSMTKHTLYDPEQHARVFPLGVGYE